MKRIYVIVGILLILGSSYAIEWYTDTRYPPQDIVITGVPDLEIGEQRTFSYMHEMELVGSTSYTLVAKEGNIHTLVCTTEVTSEGKLLELESSLIFDELYNPIDYKLHVDHEGEINQINVTFSDSQIISSVLFANETVTLTDDYTGDVLLTENNMPGFWEILLLSAELESGERYVVDAYIPQGGMVFELEFYVNPNPQTISVSDEYISCTVIQESTLDLRFYFNEGRMVQMRNDDQDLTFTLIG
ncbi:MAG: hypothetical protein NWF07_09680 [Candidatus Bathyarchaeota archaeon]|nr:hypothetical protein [Candidatus Bathyarchaeota archaeon]